MLLFVAQAAFIAAFASPQVSPEPVPMLTAIVNELSDLPTLGALFAAEASLDDDRPPIFQKDGDKLLVTIGDEAFLSDLVEAYARFEGIQILVDSDSQVLLKSTSLKVFGAPSQLKPDEVTPFVEGILRDSDYIMTASGGADTYSLRSLRAPRSQKRASVQLASGDLKAMRRHPALVMQAMMTFENIDVRQLSTNLRPTFQDPGYQSVLNMGSANTLLMRGTGLELANAIEMLRAADAAAAPTEKQETEAPSHAQAAQGKEQAEPHPKANIDKPKLVTRIFEIQDRTSVIARAAESLTRGRYRVEAEGRVWQTPDGRVWPWPKPEFWADDATHHVMVQAPERDFKGIEADLMLAARMYREEG